MIFSKLLIHLSPIQAMTYYGLHGRLRAKPGNGNDLSALLLQAAEIMKNAAGCHMYMVSRDAANPEDIYVTEVWNSKEDHDASLAMEGVPELISHAMPLLEGKPSGGLTLDVLGGKGIK